MPKRPYYIGHRRRVRRRLFRAPARRALPTARAVRMAALRRAGMIAGTAGVAALAGYGAYRGFKALRTRRLRRVMGNVSHNETFRYFLYGSPGTTEILSRKRLYNRRIEFARVAAATADNQFHRMEGNSVFVKGVRMAATLRNTFDAPIHVHMAILQEKAAPAGTTTIGENFFVDHTDANEKYVDFEEVNRTWDKQQDCAQINPQKFNIMTHEKFVLNSSGTSFPREKGTSWISFEKYFKINKRFERASTADLNVERPIRVCIWFEHVLPTPETTGNELAITMNTVAYWKNAH